MLWAIKESTVHDINPQAIKRSCVDKITERSPRFFQCARTVNLEIHELKSRIFEQKLPWWWCGHILEDSEEVR